QRLGTLLWEREEPDLAVRFDGLALATFASLADHHPRYEHPVRVQLFSLSLSLGRAMTSSVQRRSYETSFSHLGRLAAPSLSAALHLTRWVQALYDDGDVSQALAIARRT